MKTNLLISLDCAIIVFFIQFLAGVALAICAANFAVTFILCMALCMIIDWWNKL